MGSVTQGSNDMESVTQGSNDMGISDRDLGHGDLLTWGSKTLENWPLDSAQKQIG